MEAGGLRPVPGPEAAVFRKPDVQAGAFINKVRHFHPGGI